MIGKRTNDRKAAGISNPWSVFCLSLCAVLFLLKCGSGTGGPPSPNDAKRYLKLSGYEFDEKNFITAATNGDAAVVTAFLQAGINANAIDASGETALMAAAAQGKKEVVQVLLQSGVDINKKNPGGYTALLKALAGKKDDVAELLVTQPKLEVNARGEDGITPLMLYVWRSREEIVENLLKRGADVNLQEHDGDTALHAAASTGNLNIIRLLLTKGASANSKNKLGGTPLMWAAVYGFTDAVRLLLANGADARLPDVDGVTASQWADKNKRTEIAQILRDAEKIRK